MEQAEMPDCHKALGQDVLKEPVEKLHGVEVGGAEAGTAHFPGGEGDRAVREADETVVGDGHPEDIGSERGTGGVAVVIGLTVDVPGDGPDLSGIRMSEGMDGDAQLGDPSPLFCGTEGALDTGATQRGSRRRTLGMISPGGGKEPGGVTMGFPRGAEQREGLGRQGDVPVFSALATMDMDLEAWAINVRDLQGEGFMEPEAQAIDGSKVRLVVEGSGGHEESLDLLHTEDGGESVGGLHAQEREGVPVAPEDMLGEEADTTVADAHGRWGEAIDVFPVQEIALQFLFGDAVGGFVVELGQQADFPDIGFLRPFALATELKRGNHLLTQGAHEISPFVRRVVGLQRKTS
jgi:hypothetical protein